MADFSKATPRPWKTHLASDTTVVSMANECVADTCCGVYEYDYETMEANAAIIVQAVNSYDRAIELLKAARDFIQDNDLQEYTVAYDMTRCDGECLATDITALLGTEGNQS